MIVDEAFAGWRRFREHYDEWASERRWCAQKSNAPTPLKTVDHERPMNPKGDPDHEAWLRVEMALARMLEREYPVFYHPSMSGRERARHRASVRRLRKRTADELTALAASGRCMRDGKLWMGLWRDGL